MLLCINQPETSSQRAGSIDVKEREDEPSKDQKKQRCEFFRATPLRCILVSVMETEKS